MAQEPEQPPDNSSRWKIGTAVLIVVVMLGLAVYMTYRTGEIPYQIAAPLLGAALWALYNFNASGQKGG